MNGNLLSLIANILGPTKIPASKGEDKRNKLMFEPKEGGHKYERGSLINELIASSGVVASVQRL